MNAPTKTTPDKIAPETVTPRFKIEPMRDIKRRALGYDIPLNGKVVDEKDLSTAEDLIAQLQVEVDSRGREIQRLKGEVASRDQAITTLQDELDVANRLTYKDCGEVRFPLDPDTFEEVRTASFDREFRVELPEGSCFLAPSTLPSELEQEVALGGLELGYIILIKRCKRTALGGFGFKAGQVEGYAVVVLTQDARSEEEFYSPDELEMRIDNGTFVTKACFFGGYPIAISKAAPRGRGFVRIIEKNFLNRHVPRKQGGGAPQLEPASTAPQLSVSAQPQVDVKDVQTTPMAAAKPVAAAAGPSLPPPVPEVARQSVRPDARPSRDDDSSTGPKTDPKADGASRPAPTGDGGVAQEPADLKTLAAVIAPPQGPARTLATVVTIVEE